MAEEWLCPSYLKEVSTLQMVKDSDKRMVKTETK